MTGARTDRRDAWSASEIRARCQSLRQTLEVRALATPEEIAAYWPGGAENQEPGKGGWIFCYANFVGFLRRAEARKPADAAAERVVLEALRGESARVELVEAPIGPDGPVTVSVYQKSPGALCYLGLRDELITQLRRDAAALRAECTPQAMVLAVRVLDELLQQQRLCCWIVCHPAAGLPFDHRTVTRPALPEPFASLGALDIVRVLQAHVGVNLLRIHALTHLIELEAAPGRSNAASSWGLFLGDAAVTLQVQSDVLMWDWSLAGTLAQLRAHAKTQQDAMPEGPAA